MKPLRQSPVAQIVRRIWVSSLDDDVLGRAAQLAYYFFFALFPALIFLTAIIGMLFGSSSEFKENMLGYIGTALPVSAYQLILNTLNQTVRATNATRLIFGVAVALLSAASGMRAAQDALNRIYKVKEARPLWRGWTIAVVLTFMSSALVLLASAMTFYGDLLAAFLSAKIGVGPVVAFTWGIVRWPVALFLLSLVFSITYYWAPNIKRPKWKWVTPGSAVGIVGWLIASAALRIYLHYFKRYSPAYGSLGAVMLLMIWFYMSGLMLLVGAEVNIALE